MTLINLLPYEYRRPGITGLSLLKDKKVMGVGGTFLVVLTLLFYVQYQMGLQTMGGLQDQWTSLAQDMQRVVQLKNEVDAGVKKEKDFLEHHVVSPLATTALLSAVSTFLPNSIWLFELRVTRQPDENTFLLKGLSLPSPRTSSIQDIEKYLRDLKEKFPPNTELILTTSRQIKENRELTLFTAVFKWA